MTITVEATYEQGVLKPLEPIPLVEGTKVEIVVIAETEKSPKTNPVDILAEIAAMPLENGSEFSGQDHDQILYSKSS